MEDSQLIKLYDKLSELSERMAKVETMLQTRAVENERLIATLDEHEERITTLEENKARLFGVKEFIAWAVAVAIALWGVMK